MQDLNERIKQTLESHPVLLFMKGNPDFPQCGFSAQAVAARHQPRPAAVGSQLPHLGGRRGAGLVEAVQHRGQQRLQLGRHGDRVGEVEQRPQLGGAGRDPRLEPVVRLGEGVGHGVEGRGELAQLGAVAYGGAHAPVAGRERAGGRREVGDRFGQQRARERRGGDQGHRHDHAQVDQRAAHHGADRLGVGAGEGAAVQAALGREAQGVEAAPQQDRGGGRQHRDHREQEQRQPGRQALEEGDVRWRDLMGHASPTLRAARAGPPAFGS